MVLALALFSFTAPSFPSVHPASAGLVSLADPILLSATPVQGEITILSPEADESIPLDREGYVQAVQVGDGTAIVSAQVSVDSGPWVAVEGKDISSLNLPTNPASGMSSRILTFGSLFAWRPDGVHFVGGGLHTIKLKLKTGFGEFESPPVIYSLVSSSSGVVLKDGGLTNGYASFDAATGVDCSKRKTCTREIVYYIPMVAGESKTFDQKVAEANATKAKAVDAILKYACVDVHITYKSLSIPANAKGFNKATGTVTNVADFFHSLHSEPDAKVSEPGKTGSTSFKDEMKSFKQDGPIPIIGADDVAAPNPNTPGASIAGLTFKSCTGTMFSDKGKPTGNCQAQSKVFTVVSARNSPENMQHELGHRMFEDAGWPITGKNDVQQHHAFDFKDDKTTLPADNFMQEKLPSGKLSITKKQAEGMYASCKEHGGVLAFNNNAPSSNYCTVTTITGISGPVYVCTMDGGDNQNAESCWGNTQHGFKPKVPSNFDPPPHGVDVCPKDNDCPPGLKCSVSKCYCIPDWWPDPDDEGTGIGGGDPLNGTGTSQGGKSGSGTTGNGGGIL